MELHNQSTIISYSVNIILQCPQSIETHMLIVFVSLCLAKSIELTTGYSIRKVKDIIWNILDVEIVDSLTNKKFLKRMQTSIPSELNVEKYLKNVNHVLKK